MEGGLDTINQVRSTALDLSLRFGPKLVVAMLILAAGFVVAGWASRGFDRTLHRWQLEPPVRLLLVRLVRVLVLGLFAIMALQNLGIELLPLIAGLGVAGAGLALATQGVLSNVVAGLTIIFTKPYRVGEFVAIIGVEGRVEEISLFSTTLSHSDHSRIVVPNRKIVGEVLHNYGRIRQTEVKVGVAYGTDLPAVLAMVAEMARANPRVLADPAPQVVVAALADSAVQIALRPWVAVADYGVVEGELAQHIVADFERRGIAIAPPRAVRLVGGVAAA
ncbi:MAG TPA: mechanosensitive ion channel family protein [Burkholderiaceae bacterium]|nr:mechanosensitive ion channel family protein [Burkholderiaceae bacterium]